MNSIIRRLEPTTQAGAALCAAVDAGGGFLAARAREHDLHGTFAATSVDHLRELGVFGACAPVEHGGHDLYALYDVTLLVSRIAAHDASLATAVSMHLALSWYFARSVRCARPDQAATLPEARWLEALGREGMLVASTVAEPGVPAWKPETEATDDGSGWAVRGRKAMVSLSPAATHLYTRMKVLTPTGPMLASAMIPVKSAGVTVIDDWDGLGLRGSGSGRVVFDDVHLDRDALRIRGSWGEREPAGFEGRAASSAPLAGIYLGIAEAAAATAVRRYATISTPSAGMQGQMADLRLALATLRGTLHTALGELGEGLGARAPRTIDAEEGSRLLEACVLASMVTEQQAAVVVDRAMQICGGRSFTAGSELARMYRDVRAAGFMRPYAPPEEWVDFIARTATTVGEK
ncbi:acyl-CoA dehydrogenase family protein [Streptomyces sp. NBC_01465]|uniref:acyl-CoA dehydrogenase family protein n=1 Tax=Streptomyces sp. NBC_01465 TaxID=2903878 RepID=UPI002E34A928|nr:acyl-CoA dehydrogenase family protein [Streptomyces sp. NBC_01465]